MLAVLLTAQALLPSPSPVRVSTCGFSASAFGRRALLQEVVFAASAAAAFAPAWPAAAAVKAPVIDLKAELMYILRVQEACSQEVRLVSTGKYRELQRLNIKRAVGMMLENYDLAGRFNKAASAAPKDQVPTHSSPQRAAATVLCVGRGGLLLLARWADWSPRPRPPVLAASPSRPPPSLHSDTLPASPSPLPAGCGGHPVRQSGGGRPHPDPRVLPVQPQGRRPYPRAVVVCALCARLNLQEHRLLLGADAGRRGQGCQGDGGRRKRTQRQGVPGRYENAQSTRGGRADGLSKRARGAIMIN
eukprot:scaffold20339_cov120-Isochrysis_galbana.AAC.4